MRVVHICTSLTGGAGLCTARIVEATRQLGVDARILVAQGDNLPDYAERYEVPYPWSKCWLIQKIQVLLNMHGLWPKYEKYSYRRYKEIRKNGVANVCATPPITRYTNLYKHPLVESADIIHLHWVGDFLDYKSFFENVHKPILWTIHDENPGLGIFHYSSWMQGATQSFLAFDRQMAEIKREAYSHATNMTLVAISSEMKAFFLKNDLLSQFPVVTIHNGVDLEKLQMLDKSECRSLLHLPAESKILLFVAQNIHEERKGLQKLLSAISYLSDSNILLVCVGDCKKDFPDAACHIQYVGPINDIKLLNQYYAAADFLVMPSAQESFGQTPIEAMACGTPIVAFPTGIIPELVVSTNGVIAASFTAESLADAIDCALSSTYDRQQVRQTVLERFSYERIGREYVEQYKKICLV